jgi:hypothetical protein
VLLDILEMPGTIFEPEVGYFDFVVGLLSFVRKSFSPSSLYNLFV